MKKITTYKILTFILLPFAAHFGISILGILPMAIANPGLLFVVFMMACFPVYVVCSMIFLVKGIMNNQTLKLSLKDWIRVNGYGTLIYSILVFIGTAIFMFAKNNFLMPLINQILSSAPFNQSGYTAEGLLKTIKITAGVFGLLSVIIFIHLYLSFFLLKKYQQLFGNNPQ